MEMSVSDAVFQELLIYAHAPAHTVDTRHFFPIPGLSGRNKAVTRECYQFGFQVQQGTTLVECIFSEDLYIWLPGISTTIMQQRNSSMVRCVRSKQNKKPHQKC